LILIDFFKIPQTPNPDLSHGNDSSLIFYKVAMPGNPRKARILHKLCQAFTDYKQVLRVALDNISTKQIVKAREMLRREGGVLIVGKDSLTRLAVRILTRKVDPVAYKEFVDKYPERQDLTKIIDELRGKFALVFTEKSYMEIKPLLQEEKVQMAAKAGILAPNDVWIKAGPTGIDPGKIGEFHRLNIQVKTARSAIEVTKDYKLCSVGEMVSETVSAMCRLLNIIPFEYVMSLDWVYTDGELIPKEVIDMPEDQVIQSLKENVLYMTALSVESGLPNTLSVPHFIVNSFKYLMAIGLEGGYEFKQLKEAQEAQANAPADGDANNADAKEAEAEPEEEVEEEEDDFSMGGLFG
jgi:large subunit ribosomal protein LP0